MGADESMLWCVRVQGMCVCMCVRVQVSHRRSGNTQWKAKSAGLFGKGQTLVVETTRAVRKVRPLAQPHTYAPVPPHTHRCCDCVCVCVRVCRYEVDMHVYPLMCVRLCVCLCVCVCVCVCVCTHMQGEELTMDYAPGKLDSSVLLDYGVIDSQQLQVHTHTHRHAHAHTHIRVTVAASHMEAPLGRAHGSTSALVT